MQVNRIATPMAITLRSTTAADCQATAANPAPWPATLEPTQLACVIAQELAQANQAAIDNNFRTLTMRADAKAGAQVFQAYITAYYPILRTNAPRSLVDYRKQLETNQQQLQREADARSIELVAGAGINALPTRLRTTNTVSLFPPGTVPPRQTAQDKTRSVESLLGR
jgi:hypothetical protein